MAGETELTETRVGNEMAIWLWLTDNHFVIYLSNKINIRRVCTLSQLSPDQASTAQHRTEQASAEQGSQAARGAPAMWAHSAGPRRVRRLWGKVGA